MKDHYIRDKCRLCDNEDMEIILPLQKSPLCDAYIHKIKKQNFYDLNLCLCSECGFVQIDAVVDPETIYRDYIYVTTSSSGLEKHFKNYSAEVCELLNLHNSKLTVDIGSNDGTLLKFFKEAGHNVLGIDPSIEAARRASEIGVFTLQEFFNLSLAKTIKKNYGTADLITINNLLANVDDLNGFLEGIGSLLGQEGVLVIESSYLVDMIQHMVFDFIYHEHLSYFSIQPLIIFFKKFGMHLIRIQRIDTKGGSLRYFWARENSKWEIDESVEKMLANEIEIIQKNDVFYNFKNKINSVKEQMINFLDQHKGEMIVGYGASATSTTLISHFGLDKYLTYLVDDNPDKINTFSPGYHIPVFGSEKIKNSEPKVIIILAWRLKDEIIKKISYDSSIVVLPLPEFKILEM